MKDEEKDFKDKLAKISEMDNIFSKISNKYKDESDKYLLKKKLDNLSNEKRTQCLESKEKIEKDIFFHFKYPYFYLKKGNEESINIEFLVESKFIDEDKKKFSFWVCSFKYLKEQLNLLGYNQAKINKKKLFSENEEEKNEGSSESVDDQSDLDNELINYTVKVTKSYFNLNEIFDKSQKIFNPFNSIEYIEDYKKDLNIPKSLTFKPTFKFNLNYATNLKNIFKKNNDIYSYFYNEKSGLTLSLFHILETNREIFNLRYFYFNSEYLKKYKKQYFYFRLAKLFRKEEKQIFNEIIDQDENNTTYNTEYIIKILKYIFYFDMIFNSFSDSFSK